MPARCQILWISFADIKLSQAQLLTLSQSFSHCHQRCGCIWFTSIDTDRPEALVMLTFFKMTILFIIQIWTGMCINQPILFLQVLILVHLFFEGEWVIYFKLYINYNQCLKIHITENIFEKVYGNTILVYSKGFFFFFLPYTWQGVQFFEKRGENEKKFHFSTRVLYRCFFPAWQWCPLT